MQTLFWGQRWWCQADCKALWILTVTPQVWQSSGVQGETQVHNQSTSIMRPWSGFSSSSLPCMFSTLHSRFNPFPSLQSPPQSAANQMLLLGCSRKPLLTLDQSKGLLISLVWLVVQMAGTPPIVLTSWYLAITRSCYHFTVCTQIKPLILQQRFGFQLAGFSLHFSPALFKKKTMMVNRESTT